jgi:hypothetical protein
MREASPSNALLFSARSRGTASLAELKYYFLPANLAPGVGRMLGLGVGGFCSFSVCGRRHAGFGLKPGRILVVGSGRVTVFIGFEALHSGTNGRYWPLFGKLSANFLVDFALSFQKLFPGILRGIPGPNHFIGYDDFHFVSVPQLPVVQFPSGANG